MQTIALLLVLATSSSEPLPPASITIDTPAQVEPADPATACVVKRLKPFMSPYGIQQMWPVMAFWPRELEYSLEIPLSDLGNVADGYQQALHIDERARAVYVVEQGGFMGTTKVRPVAVAAVYHATHQRDGAHMNILVFLLAAATSSSPQCVAGDEAAPVLAATLGTPTPLGLILGTGSDWGAKYLIVRTTHHLGAPGIPTREGTEEITYYAAGRQLTCSKSLERSTCPALDLELRAYRDRAYAVMHNRLRLRAGAAYHPPFAILHAQDGDGNVTRIVSMQSEHPLMHDAASTFAAIASCTAGVDLRTSQP